MSTPHSRSSTRLIATCVLLRGATTATSLFPDCSYFRNSREFFKATDNSFSECSFLFTRMRSNVQCIVGQSVSWYFVPWSPSGCLGFHFLFWRVTFLQQQLRVLRHLSGAASCLSFPSRIVLRQRLSHKYFLITCKRAYWLVYVTEDDGLSFPMRSTSSFAGIILVISISAASAKDELQVLFIILTKLLTGKIGVTDDSGVFFSTRSIRRGQHSFHKL